MDHKRKFIVLICSVLLMLFSAHASADSVAEKKAVAASADWLKTIDNGRYEESWDTASLLFRNAVTKEQWIRQLTAIRVSLGNVKKRTIRSKQFATNLPGAPDGEYVVIQYDTSYANKRHAIETVTPMLDKDGRWRVSGYYIK